MAYSQWSRKTSTPRKIGENIGGILGRALQGLADFVGLGSQFSDWLNEQTFVKKIPQLEAEVNKRIAQGDLDLNELQNKLDSLAVSGMNLSGRALNVLGAFKESVNKKLKSTKAANAQRNVDYTRVLADLDSAKSKAAILSPVTNYDAEEIVRHVESYLGGTDEK